MQMLVAATLEGLMRASLPLPSLIPALQGLSVGLVLLLGFALPPLLQLKNVPAVRVMRRESGAPRGGALGAYAAGLATLAALLIWQAGDLRLGIIVVGGFSTALAAFFLIAWGALNLVTSRFFISKIRQRTLRYGLANLRRHSHSNAVQIASLALGLTAVLLLTFTHQDLVDAWRRAAPPDAPNRFVVGVQPEQVDAVKAFFAGRGIAGAEFFPMVRGRLVAVNGKPVSEADFADERAKRLVEQGIAPRRDLEDAEA
jgi:putative ABC transport system permease protein